MNNVSWIDEVITNRTIMDIFRLQNALERASRTGEAVPEMPGALNVSDLNRIENNTLFLVQKLQAFGIDIVVHTKTDWTMHHILIVEDIDRIINNVQRIVNILNDRSVVPMPVIPLPDNMTHFTHINQIEEALLRIKNIVDLVKYSYRISGTFYSINEECLLDDELCYEISGEDCRGSRDIRFPMAHLNDARVQKYVGNVESGKFSILSLTQKTRLGEEDEEI